MTGLPWRVGALPAPRGRVVRGDSSSGTGLVTRDLRLECGGASSAWLRWSAVLIRCRPLTSPDPSA